ncbi:unnamed protein product, partial [Staurois parvus]
SGHTRSPDSRVPTSHAQEALRFVNSPVVLWDLLHVCSLWSSPVLCPQSLVISCTMSAVSGHLLYCVRSLWSPPVLCLQSPSFPVLCLQ